MDSNDALINTLYCTTTEGDWQSFRGRTLGLLCQYFGANAAAWWSRGVRGSDGELTQHPEPFVTAASMAKLLLPRAQESAVLEVSASTQAFVHKPAGSALLHTVVLNYPARTRPAGAPMLERVGTHLCAAGALSMLHFVGRDDRLRAMGRANRGSAALVDAAGTVFAACARFKGLLEEAGHAADAPNLPFPLAQSVLGDQGGEVKEAGLHLRVARSGSLYLLHARKPLLLDALSPREQDIARALGNGKTLKTIAQQQGIAISTVANHTGRIYRKLAIYRREDLIEMLHLKPSTVR